MPGVVAQVGPLVSAATGLHAPSEPLTEVVNRAQWSERTLQFFSAISEQAVGEAVNDSTSAAVQTGALVGFMSKRVLGQYELVLPSAEGAADSIFFVGPNILAIERGHQFKPSEFRAWIALHECAHRAQFLGVPWMKEYFLGLVSEMTSGAGRNADRVGSVLSKAARSYREGTPFIDDSGLVGLVATVEQRATLDKVQALMSLLEGHGHAVMDRLGAEMFHTQQRMSRLLKRRRQDPKVAFLMKLSGLQMKMRQYEDGERFVSAVEGIAGWQALDAAWESPEHLPTIDEIGDAEAWLRRMG